MSRFFVPFPMLLISVIIYNIIAITNDSAITALDATLIQLPMVSGGKWIFRVGDALLFFSLIMLSIEIIKSTKSSSAALFNHGLSMLLLVVCLIQFLLFQNFATSVYFLIMSMILLDVLGGVVVTTVSARRDLGVGGTL